MPELPEVETIKRVIEPQIQGLVIDKVTVKRPEVVSYPAADEFCGLLTGQTISHMTRRGKFLIIWLNSNDRIILHLRMTGCLLLTPADYPEEKHTHIIFSQATLWNYGSLTHAVSGGFGCLERTKLTHIVELKN